MVYRKRANKKIANGKRKRDFYVSADLGAFGKYAAGYKSKRNLAGQVKNIVRRSLEEVQHKFINPDFLNMTHNTWYTLNLLGNIPQGTSATNTRNGDEIHLDCIKISHLFNSAQVNKTVFRVMIVKSPVQTLASSDNYGSGLGGPNLVQSGAFADIFSHPNPKATTVLFDKTYSPQLQNQAAQQIFTTDSHLLKIDSKIQYAQSSNFGKWSNYYVCIVAWIPGGTTGVTTVGSHQATYDLIYKDCR